MPNHLLCNQIDITQVPFSNRGSRLLVFKEKGESQLYIKLAERLVSLDPALEAHIQRPALIRNLYLLGPNKEFLNFSLTSSPDLLEFKTKAGIFQLAFQNDTTLAFGIPENSIVGISFKVQEDHYHITDSSGKSHPIRIVSYATNGVFIEEQTTPTEGGHTITLLVQSGQDCTLQVHIDNATITSNDVPRFSIIRAAARASWQAWLDRVPPVAKTYQKTYAYAWWVMANNLISPLGYVKHEAMMPTKAKYIGLWLWDSAMHTLAYRHIDPDLARNQIRVFLTHQLPDGMLPDVVFDEGIVSEINHPIRARVTKPPILAWAAMKIHEVAPDIDFLREIYVPLTHWNAWWFNQSVESDNLAQYNHPYSSGLDDSPLWDEGMPVISPDLNTYLCIQMKTLGQIASILGLETEAAQWKSRSDELVQCMLNELWDEQAGIFRVIHKAKPVPVLTPFNLYPLWTNQLPDEIQARLIKHIKNPDEFWGEIMLPTVARCDPKFSPNTMWRGPVWANINYFFIEALSQAGKYRIANELRDITLNLLMAEGGIHEYYHAETGQPPATAAPMFGWTAAVFIDLAIQASETAKNL